MKNSFIAVLLCLGLNASAQIAQIGLRVGTNLFDVSVAEFENPNNTIQAIEGGDRKLGFHAGVYGRIKIAALFIQPELLYTFQNGEIRYIDNGGVEKRLEIDYSRFDVPLIVGAKLGPIRVGVGPVATFTISEPDGAFQHSLKDAFFGYQAGLGVDLGKWSIEARYEGPLSNVAESVTIDGETYKADTRSSLIMVGMGIRLF